jgi:putative phage-type endonuclease
MLDTEIVPCQQGSLDWIRARMGCATASEFASILTQGRGGKPSKTRLTYMHKLAGEILTGEPADHFENEHTIRGQALEDEARDWYALRSGVDLSPIGFLRAPLGRGFVGASPDSLAGNRGLLEIKTKLPHLHIAALLAGTVPEDHVAQVQGQLWVSGREWCDFVSYWPKLPPLCTRAMRDEAFISLLEREVGAFVEELAELVESVRRIAA